jgi:hypothetical protein
MLTNGKIFEGISDNLDYSVDGENDLGPISVAAKEVRSVVFPR